MKHHFSEDDFFLIDHVEETQSETHYHGYLEVVFANTCGLSVVLDAERVMRVEPGEAIYISPQSRHLVKPDIAETRVETLKMNLQRLYLTIAQTPYATYFERLYSPSGSGIIISGDIAEQMRQAASRVRNAYEPSNMTEYMKIMLWLAEAVDAPEHNERWLFQRRERDMCAELNTMVTNEPSENWKIDELANHFHMSRSTFNRIIKRSTGTSFHSWLLQRKIDIACEQLVNSTASLQDIAYDLGFSSASHFAKAFRQRMQMTPTDFRHNQCMHAA